MRDVRVSVDSAESIEATISLERLGLARIEVEAGKVFPTEKGIAVFARMYETDSVARHLIGELVRGGRRVEDGLLIAALMGLMGTTESWRIEAAVLQPLLAEDRVVAILEGIA